MANQMTKAFEAGSKTETSSQAVEDEALGALEKCEFEAEDWDYEDFVEIFEDATIGRRGSTHSGPVSASEQERALAWVARMDRRGQDFNQPGPMTFLGEHSGQLQAELSPLAWAVDQGLPLVAQALLARGADPDFKFEVHGRDSGDTFTLDISNLLMGWSDTGYRPKDCEGLMAAAWEAKEIRKASNPAPSKAGSRI